MDKDARIAELEDQNAALLRRLAELEARVAALSKTSRTSSKPPSSDIVKPPPPPESTPEGSKGASGDKGKKGKKKRKPGGQPGHDKHTRTPFAAEQIDQAYDYDFAPGDTPGDDWEALDDFHVLQQVELRDNPLLITEHRFMRYRHRVTGQILTTPVPEDLRRQGLLGPRLRATTALLKGRCHVSYRQVQAFYRDVLGLDVSTGQLSKVVGQCGDALGEPYAELHAKLCDQPVVNVDETGHREQDQHGNTRSWLWCAVAERFSVFKVVASRAAKVLEELLGTDYRGIVGSDFFSAYRKFVAEGQAQAAYCWAHLVREVRYLTTLSDKVVVRWATKLLDEIKALFKAYHGQGERVNFRDNFRGQHKARDAILKRVRRPAQRKEARTLADRIRTHADAYFLFIDDDRVEPTNNKAERALRHAVIDRRITQGTRGQPGSRWLERFLTIHETCRQQDRPLLDYLVQAITHHTAGKPVPGLV